jgi:hypothetical protein
MNFNSPLCATCLADLILIDLNALIIFVKCVNYELQKFYEKPLQAKTNTG